MNRWWTTTMLASAMTLGVWVPTAHAHEGESHNPQDRQAGACEHCQAQDAEQSPAAGEGRIELSDGQQQHADAATAAFLRLQDLLADDTFEGVQAQLDAVERSARALAESASEEDAAVRKLGEAVARHAAGEPEDIDEARRQLEPLSEAMIALNAAAEPSDAVTEALYIADCPMAGRWLQTSERLANPYMGHRMLQCGGIERTLKAPAEDDQQS